MPKIEVTFVCLSVAIHEHGCSPFFWYFQDSSSIFLIILEYQVKHKIFQPSTSEKVWILYYWMIFQFLSLYSTNSNCVIPALPLSDCLWISRQPWLSYCPHDWYGIKPGSQYTSQIYRDAVCKYEIEQSMNRAGGRCHDNARCESMWARIKTELLYGRYGTEKMSTGELKPVIWRYFISYWNNRRICSANGGLPPMIKRQQYYNARKEAA